MMTKILDIKFSESCGGNRKPINTTKQTASRIFAAFNAAKDFKANPSPGQSLARLRWDKPRPAPEVDLTTLGGRIKAARYRRGLTLKQLGERVGADSAQIWKYEASRQFPTKTRLTQLVEALGEGILGDEKETSP